MVESTKKAKGFQVCTADARYVKPLIQQIINENASKGWKETLNKDKFDFKWYQSKVEDEERNLSFNA